jgi:ankyrin repeat protein
MAKFPLSPLTSDRATKRQRTEASLSPPPSPLSEIRSATEITAHHAVPSLKQLCLANLNHAQAIRKACLDGHIELIKILLRNGADPISFVAHPEDDTIEIPILAYACMKGSTSLVQLLLEKGAAPEFEMLEEAFDRGHDSIRMLLMSKGVSIDMLGDDGFSLLHLACFHQDVEAVERLIKLGADVNHPASTGETALLLTFSKSDANPVTTANIMRMLLKADANTEIRWNEQTPLIFAGMLNNTTAFSILLEAGADRTVRSLGGLTLLQLACSPKVGASIFYRLFDHEGTKLWSSAKLLLAGLDDDQSNLKWNYMTVARPPISRRPPKTKRSASTDQTI